MRILLVEDDELLGDGLSSALKMSGNTIDWVKDGVSALHAILSEAFDCVVLDLGLPGMDGLDVLKKCRAQHKQVPIMVLTARDQIQDRVKGLDLGADDYLLKPFDIDELEARLRALVRRSGGSARPEIELGDVVILPDQRRVLKQGQEVTLSRKEYELLFELASHPGQVFERSRLEELLYGWEEDLESNAMEVHVHHLRKKLGKTLIKTVRGIGYCLNLSE
ncbi:response regulator transcription factor [Litoribrevibacter albus]|uniref:DNA-binding response regulator n=1 Tax=Litoribrevibacter albus TaxID=1473156 RepID=A0AA37S9T0_9GAMM|nr:response regulator transcription factor [Litoribrevibacter albus]GLQ31141.1 DNA-binding response regulator [Litoribrevibacter albus]